MTELIDIERAVRRLLSETASYQTRTDEAAEHLEEAVEKLEETLSLVIAAELDETAE